MYSIIQLSIIIFFQFISLFFIFKLVHDIVHILKVGQTHENTYARRKTSYQHDQVVTTQFSYARGGSKFV